MADALILPSGSKAIPLTQGQYAIVDEEDYEHLGQWKWHYDLGYACRKSGKKMYMHRLIMLTPDDMQTDHINQNRLDNRRCNLRVCTKAQNKRNVKKYKGGSSKYKGVHWNSSRGKWLAQIKFNGSNNYLGRFSSEIEAAHAYNRAAIKLHGEFAYINDFVSSGALPHLPS